MWYVINMRHRYVSHESRDEASCHEYIQNSRDLFGVTDPFIIVKGAQARDKVLK